MQNNKVKNTIVLRGMASNVVDEAIVILKPNVKIKKMELTKNYRVKHTSKEFIIKEAEHVVMEYINRIDQEALKNSKMKLEMKVKKLQLISIISILLLGLSLFIRTG